MLLVLVKKLLTIKVSTIKVNCSRYFN